MSVAARGAAIDVVPIGPVATGAVAWRQRGQLHVTLIVKASFAFAPDARLPPAPPAPLARAEVHHSGSPVYSIREPADLAPRRERCDVVFAGHAHAPPGAPAARLGVRLAVLSAQGLVLCDKRLEVVGERVAAPGTPPPEPRPFERMSLVYERAYGGPGHVDNPLGVGVLTGSGGRRTLPNILHPDPPPLAPVNPPGLAPVSMLWPVRRRMLGAGVGKAMEQDVAELPADLDDVYFQNAPADQRIGYLDGDEWIMLSGLHPVHPELRLGLPSARGVARVYLPDGASRPLALWADTLLIDGDAERCSITWRGSFPVASEAALAGLAAAAGVETLGRPVSFPQHLQASPARPARSAPASPGRPAISEATMGLGEDDFEEVVELSLRSAEIVSVAPAPALAGGAGERTQVLVSDGAAPALSLDPGRNASERTQVLTPEGQWPPPPPEHAEQLRTQVLKPEGQWPPPPPEHAEQLRTQVLKPEGEWPPPPPAAPAEIPESPWAQKPPPEKRKK